MSLRLFADRRTKKMAAPMRIIATITPPIAPAITGTFVEDLPVSLGSLFPPLELELEPELPLALLPLPLPLLTPVALGTPETPLGYVCSTEAVTPAAVNLPAAAEQ